MSSLFFGKVAVRQLAHLRVHKAAAAPALSLLLHLSLLSCLARILLNLTSSPFNDSSALRRLLHDDVEYAADQYIVFKASCTVLFVVANSILVALFFSSSKGGASTISSSDQPSIWHDYINLFDAVEAYQKTYDTLNIAIAGSASNLQLANLPFVSSIHTYTPASQELAITSTTASPAPAPDSMNLGTIMATSGNQLKLVPVIGQQHLGNHLKFVHTSEDSLQKQSNPQPTIKICEYGVGAHEKPCNTLAMTTEKASSTARFYTTTNLDSLSSEEANKHFSEFVSSKWARMRTESQANCGPSPPSTLQLCLSP